MGVIIGIDLGTTNSEVAVIKDNVPKVIPVDGELIMPSCVGVDKNGGLIVGRAAKNQMISDPESTVLSIKRKMGRDTTVRLGKRRLTPEEISSFILKKLKSEAEAFLGEKVEQAVITVPAYFDDSQRKATRNAGILAGLDVTRVLNEPTAAALAYDGNLEDNETILVYDLGGGTFDVSLVTVENGVVEVRASHGDTQLGGDDFDDLLIEHIAGIFREQHETDLLGDLRSRNRLWSAVEMAKRELSDAPYASIKEEFIHGDHHLDLEISRMDYEDMIKPLLKKTLDSLHQCLKDGDLLPGDIDKILLVGGATRTPLVSQIIRHEIGIESIHSINPDLIVAIGAAVQAGVIGGMETHSVLVDITPYTFGTSAVGPHNGKLCPDIFVPIISRNTALPVRNGEAFATMNDGQEAVDVRIYQGEEPLATDNIFIGNFLIEGLGDVPAGNEIILNLQLDLNGILEVTALEKRTGLSKTVRMDTKKQKQAFDLEKARENILALAGDDDAGDLPGSSEVDKKEALLSAAKSLRKRAEALMVDIDETDASELDSLIKESRRAISERAFEKIAELNESLSDMLFYLED